MPFMFWDPTFILLILAIVLAMYAQYKVKSTYAKYNKIATGRGVSGAEVAQYILQSHNITDVQIEEVEGELTDHYDPRSKTLRLSTDNFHNSSVASLGVAAHEVGHAVQHHFAYFPLQLRNMIAPVSQFGSMLAFPLVMIGIFFASLRPLMDVGIVLFTVAVIFTIVTLPVEFDASKRALVALNRGGFMSAQEIGGARKVLNAAALTYLAAAASAILNLVRLLLIRNMYDE